MARSDRQNIEDRVIALIASVTALEPELLAGDTKLDAHMGLDSLDRQELIMSLEQEFEISIADDTAAKFKTIADIVTHIDRVTTRQPEETEIA